ncbi:MAG: S-methyl-5'-thioadenosine phosphorylase [Bacteroidales bacterium]|nr:S-methyl-5'-thioadenosine phosphorylase [Bacteroidales bacterium]
MAKIGIIGGSGLENPDILKSRREHNPDTPYGKPSSPLLCGSLNGTEIVILSRHGRHHTIPPSKVNNQANIFALKATGCTHILATTACGSLREEIERGDLVIPDQFIDFTRHRNITFFDEFEPGKMNHTPMADPFDRELRELLISSAVKAGLKIHESGTLITIEGPRFSTRAESKMFRIWGADVINMSVAPEVTLANELGIPYAAIAMSTDYDCWKDDEESVSWEAVIAVFNSNVSKVLRLLHEVIPAIK